MGVLQRWRSVDLVVCALCACTVVPALVFGWMALDIELAVAVGVVADLCAVSVVFIWPRTVFKQSFGFAK